MSETDVARGRVPPGEPRLVLPFLAPFYAVVRDLSYPLMRVTLGGLLLYHSFTSGKLTGKVSVAAFAASLAKRGLEPSVPLAYLASSPRPSPRSASSSVSQPASSRPRSPSSSR